MALTNINAITFGTKSGEYVPTLYNGQHPKFALGTAEAPLHAPFGISTPFAGGETNNLTCDLEADAELAQQIGALDEAVVQAAIKNAEEWFGRPMNEAAIRAIHTPILQVPNKEGRSYKVRTKVKTGARPTTIYVQAGPNTVTPGTLDSVTSGSDVVPFVKLSSVMIRQRQFGVSLYVEQLMVTNAAAASAGPSVFGDFVML